MNDQKLFLVMVSSVSLLLSCGGQPDAQSASDYAATGSEVSDANEGKTNKTSDPVATPPEVHQNAAFELSSGSFKSGEFVDKKYYCSTAAGGQNMPSLSWKNAPAGTKSFAVTFYAKDAPTGSGFWHGVMYNIPASATSLPGGKDGGAFPPGTVIGLNDRGERAYAGPCPPADRQHRYVFTVHALKVETFDEAMFKEAGAAYMGFNFWQNDLAAATFEFKAGNPQAINREIETAPNFSLKAQGMTAGQNIPADQYASSDAGFGCSGKSLMPKLTWTAGPKGTKSYVVTFYDKDAPTGSGFWHWVLYDIPPSVTSLSGGEKARGSAFPKGAVEGKTDVGKPGFVGPCPPPGRQHSYVYTVYALKDKLGNVVKDKGPAFVGLKLFDQALAKATFEVKAGPR